MRCLLAPLPGRLLPALLNQDTGAAGGGGVMSLLFTFIRGNVESHFEDVSAASLGTAALRKRLKRNATRSRVLIRGRKQGNLYVTKWLWMTPGTNYSPDQLGRAPRTVTKGSVFTVHIHVPVLMKYQSHARPAWVRTPARSVRTKKTSTCVYWGRCRSEEAALEHLGFWYLAHGHFGSAPKMTRGAL